MYSFAPRSYRRLLITFRNAGYVFERFVNFRGSLQNSLLLRHDIDFSINIALDLAKIDAEEKIQSTFFVQLRTPLYNALSKQNICILNQINQLGHDIAMHIELDLYDDQRKGLSEELEILQKYVPFSINNIISVHRPRNLESLQKMIFPAVKHTYEKLFFLDMAFFSDSRGEWRFGHPISSDAFMTRRSMQLSLHPLWWIARGHSPVQKLSYLTLSKSKEALLGLEQAVSIPLDPIKLFLEKR